MEYNEVSHSPIDTPNEDSALETDISIDDVLGGPSCRLKFSIDPHSDLSEAERMEIDVENEIDFRIKQMGGDSISLDRQREIYRILKEPLLELRKRGLVELSEPELYREARLRSKA